MVSTITLPPCLPFKVKAASSATASNGLIMLSTPSRMMVILSLSMRMLGASGTCLIQTTMFTVEKAPFLKSEVGFHISTIS